MRLDACCTSSTTGPDALFEDRSARSAAPTPRGVTRVAIFTDNDFDATSGVTTTLKAVLQHAPEDIRARIYTFADLETDEPDYLGLKSVGVSFPSKSGMRMHVPRMRRLRERLKSDDIRVMHLTTPGPAGVAARLLAWETGMPLLGSVHIRLAMSAAPPSEPWRWRTFVGPYMRWLYGRCHRVLVPTQHARLRLISGGWPADRIGIWPRGVDGAALSPARRSLTLRDQWRVSERRPAILYAGRLTEEKGLDLLEPIGSLLYRHRIAHRFVMVGDGPMAAELKHRLPDAVFTGRVSHEEVAVAMASADVFLCPSDDDTSATVVLEAQACGLPVIASGAGRPREDMIDGVTGFVCSAGDSQGFCRRLGQVLADESLRRTLSGNARSFALQRSWNTTLAPLFDSYRAAIEVPVGTGQGGPPALTQQAASVAARLRPVNPA